MERDFIHDPAIYKDEKTGKYYIYSTGAMCFESEDLKNWSPLGVIAKVPKEAEDWTKSNDIWAPDIIKVGDEYRLYCSNSSWGVRQSVIFLAVSDRPEGPFEPKGIVLKTSDDLPVNGIDAALIEDRKTGDLYMLYGSFWGGCHILRLDRETGLAAEDGIGTTLACRPSWQSTAIEGPYMIYREETEEYYLFVSYGSLKTDYNIRVGRSKNITGPFTDFNGRSLIDKEDAYNETGLLLLGSYEWTGKNPYMAPGHNSVLQDETGDYLVCHIRKKRFHQDAGPSEMQIRRIFYLENGWPVVSSITEAEREGELALAKDELNEEMLIGEYDLITFTPSLPQGISTALPMKLGENGYYENCSVQGTWHIENGYLHISYGPHKESAVVYRDDKRLGFSGMTDKGITFFAVKISDEIVQ